MKQKNDTVPVAKLNTVSSIELLEVIPYIIITYIEPKFQEVKKN